MSFIAKLELDGEEMNVLFCSFRLTQNIDTTGKPNAVPQGGHIQITLESTGNVQLFDWMISPTQTKNGIITFYRRDSMGKLKTLDFTDAHCVDYHEVYQHSGEYPMQVNLVISAREIKLNDSTFTKNWPQ